VPDRATRWGAATIIASVRALGPLRRPLSARIGAAWYARRPAARRVRVAAHHRRLDPELTWAQARRLARRSHIEYVTMMLDAVWAEGLRPDEVLERVHVEGREHLSLLERGGVLAISHFGNWDVAASAALAMGHHMTTVMAEVISPWITAMVAMSRGRKGLELFTPRQAARGLLRALRDRRLVALMIDVPEAGPTVTVDYCGGPVRFSAVPARLALATGVPLLPVACWRDGRRWVLAIHAPVEVRDGDDEAAVTARVAAVLEAAVRRHPEQWYPFHAVYADDPAPD
jgi:lauroyl/myristoyl acyltransferase